MGLLVHFWLWTLDSVEQMMTPSHHPDLIYKIHRMVEKVNMDKRGCRIFHKTGEWPTCFSVSTTDRSLLECREQNDTPKPCCVWTW